MKTLLAVAFLLLIFELGFRIRPVVNQWSADTVMPANSSVPTVLVLGDSVVGWDEFSFPALTGRRLGSKARIINLSRPALRTHEILELLTTGIDLYRPAAVFIMAGLSDFKNPDGGNEISQSRFAQIVAVQWRRMNRDLRNLWSKNAEELYQRGLLSLERLPSSALNRLIWSPASSPELCIRAGQLALRETSREEELASLVPKLASCFLDNRDPETAIDTLEDLLRLRTATPGRRLETVTAIINEELGFARRAAGLSKPFEDVLKAIPQGLPSHWRVRIAQAVAAGGESAKDQAEMFSALGRAGRFPHYQETQHNLVAIARLMQLKGVPLILAQYPTESVERLAQLFSAERPTLFDAHSIILAHARSETVSNLLADDLFHLSRRGHEIMAEALANTLQEMLN